MEDRPLRTLLIDNYDSYTYNLYQRILCASGRGAVQVTVLRNDEVEWEDLRDRMSDFDNVVIGPGPGVPSKPADFGLGAQIIRWAAGLSGGTAAAPLPVLGVCLGHQGLAWALGGTVVRAPRAAHGVLSPIQHDGTGLFDGVPADARVVRYHSWLVDSDTLPTCLAPTAWTIDDGGRRLIMAMAHRTAPLFGVQFHPESVCTQYGDLMLANFARITRTVVGARSPPPLECCRTPCDTSILPIGVVGRDVRDGDGTPGRVPPRRAVWRRLPDSRFPADQVGAFRALFGGKSRAFWLDSSRTDSIDDARFSYMGACAESGLAAVSCDLASGTVTEWQSAPGGAPSRRRRLPLPPCGFFGYLAALLEARGCAPDPALPCGLCGGGMVGYIGYEMRAECGARPRVPPARKGEPDAAFLVVDRFVALDHVEKAVYVVALVADGADADGAAAWFDLVDAALDMPTSLPPLSERSDAAAAVRPTFTLDRDRTRYMADIGECLREIADGESYELCLTNKARAGPGSVLDPLDRYVDLRRTNPAPYAAFVRLGEGMPTLISSSPEKFISVDRERRARSKPIKGTAKRGVDPADDQRIVDQLRACPKTFAENLMIVDLVRNDLGTCCVPGSVGVPPGRLMAVETYSSVHQVVTTVDGTLKPDRSTIGCVRACFPPGSMTGAPKVRSTDILDRLEDSCPRGVYSGALGFFSADGACCLSVVIRTAVVDSDDGSVSVGCGGAIVADSDPDAEFDEILLKADRVVKAMGATGPIGGSADPSRVLVETLRLEADSTYRLEGLHIQRIVSSALALGLAAASVPPGVDVGTEVRRALAEAARAYAGRVARVRITFDLDSAIASWTAALLNPTSVFCETPDSTLAAMSALAPDECIVARVSPLRRAAAATASMTHKTAARGFYEKAHARAWSDDTDTVPEALRETLLVNERGQITEGVKACVALIVPGSDVPLTPPLECGLLPGTMRHHLLDGGLLAEAIITMDDLRAAAIAGRPILLFNAVRGVYAARIDLSNT